MINIRRFTKEGSTVTPTILEEAEAILKEHQAKGGLVVDDDKKELIQSISLETQNILLLDPITGG